MVFCHYGEYSVLYLYRALSRDLHLALLARPLLLYHRDYYCGLGDASFLTVLCRFLVHCVAALSRRLCSEQVEDDCGDDVLDLLLVLCLPHIDHFLSHDYHLHWVGARCDRPFRRAFLLIVFLFSS